MKIEKNETALGWMGKLKVEIIESGHAYLDLSLIHIQMCIRDRRLQFTAKLDKVYNPSFQSVWIAVNDNQIVEVKGGEIKEI